MPEPRVEVLFLLPGRTKTETSLWGAALVEYAAHYPGVTVSFNFADAARPEFERIVVVNPEGWSEDLWLLIKQNPRRVIVERLEAASPKALADLLHRHVEYGLRFSFGAVGTGDWRNEWTSGVTLIGLHGRSDGEMQAWDYDITRTARVEAIKLTSHASPKTVERLRDLNPNIFIMVRPIMSFYDSGRPRHLSPHDFLAETGPEMQALFDADPAIQYVEIHNEPNLVIEGLGGSWNSGGEFGSWFLETMELMRKEWPDKLYGFPGLSPGSTIRSIRQDMKQFLSEAQFAAARADWVGVHGYWQSEAEMTDVRHGFTWKYFREAFPDKLMFITEFGNPTDSKPVVADQYARYYGMLRRTSGLGGAFAYVVSTSNSYESVRWAWRDENGNDVGIAREVGARKHIPG